jgi:hypothetical protein
MQANSITSHVGTEQVEDHAARGRRFSLTQFELLQLGMFHVGYVRAVTSDSGDVEIVVHGADGQAVAEADSIEFAAEAADELGLALVAVH